MTIKVRFSLWGDFFVPWALPNSDACKRPNSDISDCPYPAGTKISHSTSMPVPSIPLRSGNVYNVTIQYSLYDQNDNLLCCLRAPAQVMKHPQEQN